MRHECKCHGLSGSCTLQTCWKKMSSLREIGIRLKSRFDGAVRVLQGNDGRTVVPAMKSLKPPSREDLVYAEESPDYCTADRRIGSLGTKGRPCNATSAGADGCDLLCCGRGYETKVLR